MLSLAENAILREIMLLLAFSAAVAFNGKSLWSCVAFD